MSLETEQLQHDHAEMARDEHLRRIEELGQVILAYSDVTERLEASHTKLAQRVAALQEELSEKNRLLERRERTAALGEMAAGLAHEIRNPLGAIQLYATMLRDDLKQQPVQLALAQKIGQGVIRLESLVSQILEFTRELRVRRLPCVVAAVVQEAIDLARAGAGAKAGGRVTIEAELDLSLRANLDSTLFSHSVLNLLHNSIEAIDGNLAIESISDNNAIESTDAAGLTGGVVKVVLSRCTKDEGAMELTVEDTGPGIPADILQRIFHPFFTTKAHGTGLGLSIVHRVVEAHDGTIVAACNEAGGASFRIRVPLEMDVESVDENFERVGRAVGGIVGR